MVTFWRSFVRCWWPVVGVAVCDGVREDGDGVVRGGGGDVGVVCIDLSRCCWEYWQVESRGLLEYWPRWGGEGKSKNGAKEDGMI